MEPFWPRRSPHFLACRRAVRGWTGPAVIGLSGGADSLALVAAAAAERLDVTALVVDHGLQEGSAEVARRAAEQAQNFGVPADVTKVSITPTGKGTEADARQARYVALFDQAGPDRDVWTAHTADDQAETLLLGALRGNPAGMSPRAGRLVRPLLHVRRADTAGACAELGITPWQDPMNKDERYRRVALRTRVIPLLEEIVGGEVVPALAGTADRIAEAAAQLQRITPATSTDSGALDCAELASLTPVVRRAVVAEWVVEKRGEVKGAHLAAIEALVTNWRGQGAVQLGSGVRVARRDGTLVFV